METKRIVYYPIGVISTPFKKPRGTPIQPRAARGIKGRVIVYEKYREGLKGLRGFSHIILLFHFHLSAKFTLLVKPYMDNKLYGVFATRAPRRPNSIGISVVKLKKIKGNVLYVEDIDIVDGTPLLDVKPYVPHFDTPEVKRIGWLAENIHQLPRKKDDGRFLR